MVESRVSLAKVNPSKLRDVLAHGFKLLFQIRFLKSTFFGFYERLFKPFRLFRGIRKTVNYRRGIVLDLNLDDWIQQNLYFLNEYEEREIRFVESFLKEGNVFVDIGANIGLYSLVASRVVGAKGQVYGLEPSRDNYAAFLNHIQLNKAENIIAEQVAIVDADGILSLHIDEKERNSGGASVYLTAYSKTESVTAKTLDGFFAEKGITSVSMIKMDIEGGEYLALKGMKGILEKYKPILLIEIDAEVIQRTSHTQADIENFLYALGYGKYYLDQKGAIRPEKPSNYYSTNCVFLTVDRIVQG